MAKYFHDYLRRDFQIMDEEDKVVCHLRVKPNSIAVKGKKEKKWYRVQMEDFTTWVRENGKPSDG